MKRKSIGIVGARGFTGAELVALIRRHPGLKIAFLGSRAGATPSPASTSGTSGALYSKVSLSNIREYEADLYVLALPDGRAAEFVHALGSNARIVDLSSDHRQDSAWQYGLPERFREGIRAARRVANPGCYATAVQLSLLPLLAEIQGVPRIFGLSGWSGAGRKPSPRNDLQRLEKNIIPYALTGHKHEAEISNQCNLPVCFHPHVASHFRGISCTISLELEDAATGAELRDKFVEFYRSDKLVSIAAGPPEIRKVAHTPRIEIGGFAVDARDPRRIAIVSVLDNLQKGAASQALQNINLMLGFDEYLGLSNG